MPDNIKPWQISKLLNRYYDKIGMSATGNGRCPVFTEFRAGYGLVDETNPAQPKLLPIPPDIQETPGEFYRGLVDSSYSDGVTLCKCEIPQGAVGAPVRHNFIGLYDQDGDLVAVCVQLPDWLTPDEVYRAYPAITFPRMEEEEED